MPYKVKKPDNKISVIVSGQMFAGKSTFKDVFIEQAKLNNVDFQVQPLALELKTLMAKYYGLTLQELEEVKPVIRGDLQRVGTELLRDQFSDDFWTILALRNPAPYLIFDDCRFQSEVKTIEEFSTKTFFVAIVSDDASRKERCDAKYGVGYWEKQNQSHSSETSTPGPHLCTTQAFPIKNNYRISEEEFRKRCVEASQRILDNL
jgi:hypothetical protein